MQEDELAQTVRRFEGQMRDLEQRLEDRSRAGELQGCRTQWSLPGSLAYVSMYVRMYVHSVTEYSYVIYVFHGTPLCLICTCAQVVVYRMTVLVVSVHVRGAWRFMVHVFTYRLYVHSVYGPTVVHVFTYRQEYIRDKSVQPLILTCITMFF